MNIFCDKDLLLESLNTVIKAVAARTVQPILECFLLIVEEDNFKVIGNDLELSITLNNIKSEIIQEGRIAIEARLFIEIIRKLPEGRINIYTDDKNIVYIKSTKVEFKIMCFDPKDFPLIETESENLKYTLKALDFKNMIRQTIFSVSLDESKPILTGELIEIENNILNIVAIDGFRIAHKKLTVLEKEKLSVIVPSKSLNEISKILPSTDELINIIPSQKHITITYNNCLIVSSLKEGEFVKYKEIFTEEFSTKVFLKRQNLLSSLERASLISREAKKSPVILNIENNIITISSNTEIGMLREEMTVEREGKNLEIGFNPKYLIDVLKVMEQENIVMQFTTPLNPCIIKPADDEDSRYLILPLRLKN